MEIQYVHVKIRSQFGKQCIFDDEGPKVDADVLPNRELMQDYIYRNPCHVPVQKSTQLAVHEVQTSSAATKETGMSHTEGGWPRETNPRDEEATARYRRRVEKDDNWPLKMKILTQPMEHCVLQNNAVNIYDNFFDDMLTTELVLPLEARTVNVYEDPQTVVRPTTHLSWSPDHGKRLAVAYCSMEFQREPGDLNPWSYIWDIENPNKAFMALRASCPLATIEFNPRDPLMLISGLMSGQVCNWDIRMGDAPVQLSHLQFSHRNPANLALWINSKSNTEFFSASTDGAIKWWDLRKLREPTETLVMDLENPMRGDIVGAIGVSSLEYEPTMGTKFMAGLENGIVVSGTRKGKNPQEKLALRFLCHDGPVVSVDRSPFSPKNFLTVGGRVAKIWAEDTREGNLISTRQHRAPLNGGCWSTSRYSLFYVIDADGSMEAYDVLVGVKSPVKSIRLCENALKAMAPHEGGTLVAVGCDKGKVYLVEFSEALTTNSRNDKALMTAYFDRSSRYEKAIDGRLKEMRLAQKSTDIQEPEEEPEMLTSPQKGRGKEAGKDARGRAITGGKSTEDKASRGASPGRNEGKDRKSKIKIKGAKESFLAIDDPELADAELRYYEILHKEMEKYAEVAALEEEGGKPAAASPSTKDTGAKRRAHDEAKEASKSKLSSGKDRRKEPKAEGEKGGRDDVRSGEIVIVKKSKRDTTAVHQGGEKTSGKMDEHTELERITEEHDRERLRESEGKRAREAALKRAKKSSKSRGKGGEKSVTRGKRTVLETGKPCTDYVCEPDVCCLDETAHESEAKHPKPKPQPVVEFDPDIEAAIEDMLAGLPKAALPYELQPLDDEEPTREQSDPEGSDAPPRILEEAARIARREARGWRELTKQGRSGAAKKLQYQEPQTLCQILECPYTQKDSDQTRRRGKRFPIDGEHSRDSTPVREADSCEPTALKFGPREMREIVGTQQVPIPPTRPRSETPESRLAKRGDYPRISAAAMPKLEPSDDPMQK